VEVVILNVLSEHFYVICSYTEASTRRKGYTFCAAFIFFCSLVPVEFLFARIYISQNKFWNLQCREILHRCGHTPHLGNICYEFLDSRVLKTLRIFKQLLRGSPVLRLRNRKPNKVNVARPSCCCQSGFQCSRLRISAGSRFMWTCCLTYVQSVPTLAKFDLRRLFTNVITAYVGAYLNEGLWQHLLWAATIKDLNSTAHLPEDVTA
jgi:hypothetical protein